MKKFIFRFIIFVFPIMVLLILSILFYIINDPFEVVWKYKYQFVSTKNYQISLNRDFQSTQLFLMNYKKNKYNSFILGNSRSLFYLTETWNKYINGNCFHFDASKESLYGINCKLNLINELNLNIKNVMIIMDVDVLKQVKNTEGHLFIKHPILSKESYLSFQYEMFKGFFPKTMIAYTDLFFNGKKKYMSKYGIIDNLWKHDFKSNQLKYYVYDQQIKINPDLYYADKKNIFYKRDSIQIFNEPVIGTEQKILLLNICKILTSNKTNFKIIISPLYDQIKFNCKDLNFLKNLFGSENVFDFSGINTLTADYRHYYESSHYRPVVCDSIMKMVYLN